MFSDLHKYPVACTYVHAHSYTYTLYTYTHNNNFKAGGAIDMGKIRMWQSCANLKILNANGICMNCIHQMGSEKTPEGHDRQIGPDTWPGANI